MPQSHDRTSLNVTLPAEHARKLSGIAEQSRMTEETLACVLLCQAIDEASVDAENMVASLSGIPGALERAELGRRQARAGEVIPVDRL